MCIILFSFWCLKFWILPGQGHMHIFYDNSPSGPMIILMLTTMTTMMMMMMMTLDDAGWRRNIGFLFSTRIHNGPLWVSEASSIVVRWVKGENEWQPYSYKANCMTTDRNEHSSDRCTLLATHKSLYHTASNQHQVSSWIVTVTVPPTASYHRQQNHSCHHRPGPPLPSHQQLCRGRTHRKLIHDV